LKLVAVYKVPGSDEAALIRRYGTAIAISHNICVTAAHCILPTDYIDSETNKTAKLAYIGFNNSLAVVPTPMNQTQLERYYPQLTMLPYLNTDEPTTFNKNDCSDLAWSKYLQLDDLVRSNYWGQANDYIFLKSQKPFPIYARPTLLEPGSTVKAAVVGHPNALTFHQFCEAYGSNTKYSIEELKHMYFVIAVEYSYFERKLVMAGEASEKNGILLHNCPTIGGVSGGLVTAIRKDWHVPTMNAVHIGGCRELEQNYSLSVNHKGFATEMLMQLQKHSPSVYAKELKNMDEISEFHINNE